MMTRYQPLLASAAIVALSVGSFLLTPDVLSHSSADTPATAAAPAAATAPVANPSGRGESLILVVGGLYETQAEAESAVAASNQSEFQGYYLTSTDEYKVRAAYAEIQPTVVNVPCSADNAAQVPPGLSDQLGSVDPAQLLEACEAAAESSQDGFAVKAHARLERVPVVPAAAGGGEVPSAKSCAVGAQCLTKQSQDVLASGVLPANQWMAVTAFRTRKGAEAFLSSLRVGDGQEPPLVVQVRRVSGSSAIGLGQEPRPDGAGPLVQPLPDQEAAQL